MHSGSQCWFTCKWPKLPSCAAAVSLRARGKSTPLLSIFLW